MITSWTASNGWLEKWKTGYGIRETGITEKRLIFQSPL